MYKWQTVCQLDDIPKGAGVCAEFDGKQIAIFHLHSKQQALSVSNTDPFTAANVLSRGLTGEADGRFYVASPLLKQRFCLETGICLDDENYQIQTYQTRIQDGLVQLAVA